MIEHTSAYFRLTPERREHAKQRARDRYHGPAGSRQKTRQYLRALNCGLIQKPGRALTRHGIVWHAAEGWILKSEDLADAKLTDAA